MNAVSLENKTILVTGECEIIRGCHNRDKGTAEWGDSQRTGKRAYPLFVLAGMTQKSNVWGLDVVTSKGEDCFPKDIKQLIVQSEIELA